MIAIALICRPRLLIAVSVLNSLIIESLFVDWLREPTVFTVPATRLFHRGSQVGAGTPTE